MGFALLICGLTKRKVKVNPISSSSKAPDTKARRRRMAAALAIGLSAGLVVPAQATLYVYQTPDGSRLITDRPVADHGYRLLHHSATAAHVGAWAAGRMASLTPGSPSAYDKLIRQAAAVYHLDPALIKAMIHVESAFDATAVSRKGARGLMQLMPSTAKRYGVRNTFDPSQNVYAGVHHFKDLLVAFGYNYRLALAAYNAGANAVREYRGVPPFPETIDYIQQVQLLRNRYSTKYW